MDAPEGKYLIFIKNKWYTIKIYERNEGHHLCSYQILKDNERTLYESSTKKILLRILYAIEAYKNQFSKAEKDQIINDIKEISRALKISGDFVEKSFKAIKLEN